MDDTLFCYSLMVQDREFTLEVKTNGVIYWEDYQDPRRCRNPAERDVEIRAFLGVARLLVASAVNAMNSRFA